MRYSVSREEVALRNAIDVAKRCTCLEVLCQRIALEQQTEELGDEAQRLRDNLIAGIAAIDCEGFLFGTEADVLCAPLGEIDLEDEHFAAWFADVAVLAWCLGRIDELPTVDELMGEKLNEVLSRGFWASGDAAAIKDALAHAQLRPRAELERFLVDAARANAIAVSANPAVEHTELPPETVFYVMPWIFLPAWPWGKPCDLETDLGLRFTLSGVS